MKSLAARKRQLVKDELTEAALKLLAFQGFEETTIDQITTAAGVSRRTFFRYFESKEDVVIEFLSDAGQAICDTVAARPPEESALHAVREAFIATMREYNEHPDKAVRLARLILETPALTARYLERQSQWRTDLAAEIARRMRLDPAADYHPALLAALAFAAFDTALATWVRSDGATDPAELVAGMFTAATEVLST